MSGGTVAVVFTDGREHIFDEQRIRSWEPLVDACSRRIIFDDSADEGFGRRLRSRFVRSEPPATAWTVVSWKRRHGFAGTIHEAWDYLRVALDPAYVLHLEDDFVLRADIEIEDLTGILERQPELAQVSLLRQPWNDAELAAGGIIQVHPERYRDAHDEHAEWVEHGQCFTTNPCVYRGSLLSSYVWPVCDRSEGVFTHELVFNGYRFAIFGRSTDAPRVEHVGAVRVGTGY